MCTRSAAPTSMVCLALALAGLPVGLAAQAPGAAASERSPALALGLSVLLPGAGQIYNGQHLKGVVMFAGAVATSWAIVLTASDVLGLDDDTSDAGVHTIGAIGIGLVLWSWIDAPLSARAINRRIRAGRATLDVGALLVPPGPGHRLDVTLLRAAF